MEDEHVVQLESRVRPTQPPRPTSLLARLVQTLVQSREEDNDTTRIVEWERAGADAYRDQKRRQLENEHQHQRQLNGHDVSAHDLEAGHAPFVGSGSSSEDSEEEEDDISKEEEEGEEEKISTQAHTRRRARARVLFPNQILAAQEEDADSSSEEEEEGSESSSSDSDSDSDTSSTARFERRAQRQVLREQRRLAREEEQARRYTRDYADMIFRESTSLSGQLTDEDLHQLGVLLREYSVSRGLLRMERDLVISLFLSYQFGSLARQDRAIGQSLPETRQVQLELANLQFSATLRERTCTLRVPLTQLMTADTVLETRPLLGRFVLQQAHLTEVSSNCAQTLLVRLLLRHNTHTRQVMCCQRQRPTVEQARAQVLALDSVQQARAQRELDSSWRRKWLYNTSLLREEHWSRHPLYAMVFAERSVDWWEQLRDCGPSVSRVTPADQCQLWQSSRKQETEEEIKIAKKDDEEHETDHEHDSETEAQEQARFRDVTRGHHLVDSSTDTPDLELLLERNLQTTLILLNGLSSAQMGAYTDYRHYRVPARRWYDLCTQAPRVQLDSLDDVYVEISRMDGRPLMTSDDLLHTVQSRSGQRNPFTFFCHLSLGVYVVKYLGN